LGPNETEQTQEEAPQQDVRSIWRPRFNISETEKAYRLTADLPGVPKEVIKLEVKDGLMTVSGEKKEDKGEQGEQFHSCERVFGCFSRSFRLPEGIKPDTITAKCVDGVLEIVVPKPPPPVQEVTTIQVK
jgi:HSP20 family protein